MVAVGSLLHLYHSFLLLFAPQFYCHSQANKTRARSLVEMQWATLLAAAAFAQNVVAQNMLRFACSQLVVERTDPLVNRHEVHATSSPDRRRRCIQHHYGPHQRPCPDFQVHVLQLCTGQVELRKYLSSFKSHRTDNIQWTAVMFFKAKNGTYM
jgi:hypothetical protein